MGGRNTFIVSLLVFVLVYALICFPLLPKGSSLVAGFIFTLLQTGIVVFTMLHATAEELSKTHGRGLIGIICLVLQMVAGALLAFIVPTNPTATIVVGLILLAISGIALYGSIVAINRSRADAIRARRRR